MIGDSTDERWGVMDIIPRTDFPDIRKKAAIQSDAGFLGIIPREGNVMARFYIELGHESAEGISLSSLQDKARQIFKPYTMGFAETQWWSYYTVGQRLVDSFTKNYRVFLLGDAAHTHSPKAGQGINVSLQDAHNVAWKLAAVLRGRASPGILETYVSERGKLAAALIEFDRSYAKMFSSSISIEEINRRVTQSRRYTAGLGTRYGESCLVSRSDDGIQMLAKAIAVGERFPGAQVVRFCDAYAMQILRALPADSRWRVVVFGGDILKPQARQRLGQVSHRQESRPLTLCCSAL